VYTFKFLRDRRREDIGSTYPDNLKTMTKALVQLVLKTLVQFIRLS
jgi:hypothetical protein